MSSQNWPLPERFRVRLTMESDWHVGSGMGRPGNIDRLIARDADDLPFVPAKTLRGIWRDACERLCRGLDDGQNGAWSRMVDWLFGSQPALGPNDPTERHSNPANVPLGSAVQIRSARIPSPLLENLAHADRRLRQALTFVKPGVKIDRRSGSAQTDFLRFEEVARKGMILEADCRLTVRDARARELASALLVASAKLVERLGGKRRRGTGRCRLEVIGTDVSAAVAWLHGKTLPPEWSSGEVSESPSDMLPAADSSDPWLCVPLVLHLQGPLAVSHRTTGNVVETLDFVPGSYLLPHVTQTLSGLGLDVRSAIQAGEICVLPAHPEVDGERGQPVPLAWFAPKGVEKPLEGANRAQVVNRLLHADTNAGTQLKQMRDGYVSTQAERVYKTPLTVRTHSSVEDEPQRPTETTGGVYSYEAIAPSDHGMPVILRSELRIRKSLAERLGRNWWDRLNGEVALGRSKKDDYGYVRLDAAEPVVFTSNAAPRNDPMLFVWLVSDTLVRNSRLRPEPTAACLGEELSRRLGVTLKLRESSNGGLDELVRIRRLETWHVGWGLPRPSLIALQAGSCMVFELVSGTLDSAKLAQLEARGVGERTAEGYGQVRSNHPLLVENLSVHKGNAGTSQGRATSVGTVMIAPSDPSFSFARRIETECWRQEIRRACLSLAADARKRNELLGWDSKRDNPPMSQLGGLRGQLMLMQTADQRQRVLDWLEHLKQNKRRREKWPSIPKVKALIESDSRIWEVIETKGWPTLTANAEERLQRELWALAVRTFFDACIRAHKRDLEVARGT
ncbi:MAG: RAMP superfamily CRISPR-associated protein [Gemmataceae bacterium]|nr:RAMP superfamily CRISPR-associated protein [Gemmataceae bacterium]